ncbi:hypothetical protein DFS34DRAFT_390303 [Phlyctochytrium arcticum]|nr:hypothetical protein DFS34DRAFT_390303 [Phlyctochytrium arcticum]
MTPRCLPAALARRGIRQNLTCNTTKRFLTSGGKRLDQSSNNATPEVSPKNTFSEPSGHDRSLAHAAFLAGPRPLASDAKILTDNQISVDIVWTAGGARQADRKITVAQRPDQRIYGSEQYHDEYAKLFSTFTPFHPPSECGLANPSPTSTHSIQSRPNPSEVTRYLNSRVFSQEPPSHVQPPRSSATSGGTITPALKPVPIDDLLLSAFFASAKIPSLGHSVAHRKWMEDTYGKGIFSNSSEEEARNMDLSAAYAATCGRTSRQWKKIHAPSSTPGIDTPAEEIQAISILKRRRKKMKKHKWKKLRKRFEGSTRYNKERKKRGGAQREKQE